jgi:phage recombination protein Bet
MSQALAVVEGKETRLAHATEFSNEQIRLLSETIAKNCDQNELSFFINVCKLKRLDPFSGQVHCVKRWDSDLGREKMTIQVGIDGFRVIASRTGDHAGTSEPEFDSEDGQRPNWARVTVYRYGRDNEKIPYTVKARYSEFVNTKKDGTPNRMWATKPYIMLAKCAEAQALRKAFPDELSGMYAEEEMGQADDQNPPEGNGKKAPIADPQRASQKQPQPQTQTQPQTQDFQGIIESVKQANSGALWLTIKGLGLVKVEQNKVDGDMKPGYFLQFHGRKDHDQRLGGDFYVFISLRELSPVEDANTTPAEGAKLAPDAEQVAKEMFPDKTVQGMVDNGTLKPASEIETKTIGKKRAQRIYALCTQNKAKNGGLDEAKIKDILSVLPTPLEHLSDLETGLYEQFEKWATGEEDWKTWLDSD